VAAVEEFLSERAEDHVGVFAVGQHCVDARPTSLNRRDAMHGVMALEKRERAGRSGQGFNRAKIAIEYVQDTLLVRIIGGSQRPDELELAATVGHLQHEGDGELTIVEMPSKFFPRLKLGDLQRVERIGAAIQQRLAKYPPHELGQRRRLVNNSKREIRGKQVVGNGPLCRTLRPTGNAVGRGLCEWREVDVVDALTRPSLRRKLLGRLQAFFDGRWCKEAGKLAHTAGGHVVLATGNKRLTLGRVEPVDGIALKVDGVHRVSLARG
jgi:hypothetical protein